MHKALTISAAIAILAASSGCAAAQQAGVLTYAETTPLSAAMVARDPFTITGQGDLMDQQAINANGTVKAIIEIPAGTLAKWEISKDNPQAIEWEITGGHPRVVQYLGYPANYGAIPGTDLPKELGGDGDPLDVLVLGQAIPRGETVNVRVIGVLRMLDGGEQDNKLIAVIGSGSPFSHISGMAQLDAEFPAASQIIDLWFANYKGPDGGMVSQGFGDAAEALAILEAAAAQFEAAR